MSNHLLLVLTLAIGMGSGGAGAQTAAPSADAPTEAQAQTPVPAEQLAPASAGILAFGDTLKIGETLEVMRSEGVDYGGSLEAEMFPGRGGAEWQAVVGLIYDVPTMRARFDAVIETELGGDQATLAAAAEFFGSPAGQKILNLELEARRALLEESVEEASKVLAEEMTARNDPRMEAIRRFAQTNDLIESNVSGALNANLAFYQGLVEGGAMEEDLTEDQMLTDVWSQEPQVRAETEEWLFSYLALAYQPLSDAELADYQAFSETPAGQKVNAALFVAFNQMFRTISHDLGRAAARQMQGEDI